MVTIHNVDQLSDEWFELRLGLVTGSQVSTVMAGGTGDTRAKYMRQLSAEIITGLQGEKFSNKHTERGQKDEPIAIDIYQELTGNIVKTVGFVTNDLYDGMGCSPDSECGNGILECKSRLGHIQIDLIETGKIPKDAYNQMMFNMTIFEKEWCDYVSYSDGLPLFVKRLHFDENESKKIIAACNQFVDELRSMVDRVKRFNTFTDV